MPVRVLFDNNVVLDVLLEREPHVVPAVKLFALVDNGRIQGSICATTAITIYYIAAKSFAAKRARDEIHALLGLFELAPVDRLVLDSALDIDFTDHEDAVVHEAADDIAAAFEWHESKRAGLGAEFVQVVEAVLVSLLDVPESCEAVHRDIRRCLMGEFPFEVFCRPEPGLLVILACVHAALDPQAVLRRIGGQQAGASTGRQTASSSLSSLLAPPTGRG